MRALIVAAVLSCSVVSSLPAQTAPAFELRGATGQRMSITSAVIASLAPHEVAASAHGVTGRFSGASLADLVHLVGAPVGDSLRGPALASYVLVEAADGYRVTFSLAEFNSSFTDRLIIVADAKDGKALDAKDGPFQLIVPDEKRPARWVRQVTRISIVAVPPR